MGIGCIAVKGQVLFNQEETMVKEPVTDKVMGSSPEGAVAVLAKSIARLSEAGELLTTAVPGLGVNRLRTLTRHRRPTVTQCVV